MSRSRFGHKVARISRRIGRPDVLLKARNRLVLRYGVPLALVGIGPWGTVGFSAPDTAPLPLTPPIRQGATGAVERLINEDKLTEASANLEGRIESEGETARNLLLRGLILYRSERHDEALVDLKRSFVLDEEDPNTSKALGLCLVRLGREDLAETFFAIAVTLAPQDHMAHFYLGLNAYTTKRFDQAVQVFEKAVSLRPDSIDSQGFLGRSYEALGNIERAGEHYSMANNLNRARERRSPDPPLLLGSMLFRHAQFDRAERHLREALDYDQGSGLAHYWLGLLLEQRSENLEAIRSLQRAAALAPADHRPHYALARIYRKVGNPRSAAEAVRKFRELRVRSESETF